MPAEPVQQAAQVVERTGSLIGVLLPIERELGHPAGSLIPLRRQERYHPRSSRHGRSRDPMFGSPYPANLARIRRERKVEYLDSLSWNRPQDLPCISCNLLLTSRDRCDERQSRRLRTARRFGKSLLIRQNAHAQRLADGHPGFASTLACTVWPMTSCVRDRRGLGGRTPRSQMYHFSRRTPEPPPPVVTGRPRRGLGAAGSRETGRASVAPAPNSTRSRTARPTALSLG